MATQYPLQSKAFALPLSALYQLSSIPYSVFTHANAVALFATIASEAKPFKTHHKPSNHLPCKPITISLPEHAFECFNQAKTALFNLNIHCSNTQTAAANDATYNNANERKVA